MHTEQLRNVRPSWVAFGWFIGAAVAALIIFALIAIGVLLPDSAQEQGVWIALALMVGFAAGGFFAGARTGQAPLLHGLGIGIFTIVVWFVANLLPGEATGLTAWRVLPTAGAMALLLLIAAAAVVGARMGARWARQGAPAPNGNAPPAA